MSTSKAVQKCDTVWLEAGDLIVGAEDMRFRVCSSLLCQHSHVFRDLIGLPQPPDAEKFEGLPVIRFPDPAQDLTHFLRALHDSSFMERTLPTTFNIVSSVLTLSTKYDVNYLRERAISHLITNYPTTIDGWNKRDSLKTISDIPYLDFAALSLAETMDVPQVLPAILYSICSRPVPEIFDGFQLYPSPELQRTCLEALQPLWETSNQPYLMFIKNHSHPICVTTFLHQSRVIVGVNVLELCAQLWKMVEGRRCATCLVKCPSEFDLFKRNFWNKLPSLFKFSSWSALGVTED